jgi:DNA/RNA endonuclease YhcR with UshA esterase domain
MTRIQALIGTLALTVLYSPSRVLGDAANIAAADAIHFVGQVTTVCGRVASAKYASETKGQPTFLNLDKPYPNHVFTAVIWGKDRGAFPYVPESMAGRHICVSGTVQLYREKAEITVSAPGQIHTTQ